MLALFVRFYDIMKAAKQQEKLLDIGSVKHWPKTWEGRDIMGLQWMLQIQKKC